MSLTVYTVGSTKAWIGFVEDSSSQQTETTVSNKNECITKITSDKTSIPRFAKLQNEINTSSSSSSSFEEVSTPGQTQTGLGRGFILLLPQTAALPGSDAGSDVIKPASSFVIQNRQTSCSMWCPMYRARC